jgi:hypothetical protein
LLNRNVSLFVGSTVTCSLECSVSALAMMRSSIAQMTRRAFELSRWRGGCCSVGGVGGGWV